jgi:hypothetical protein
MLSRFHLLVLFLVLPFASMAQIVGLSVEHIISHPYGDLVYTELENPEEYITYIISVEVTSPTDRIIALYAQDNSWQGGPMFITYDEDCYDHPLYGVNMGFDLLSLGEYEDLQDVCFDTFLTIGYMPDCNPVLQHEFEAEYNFYTTLGDVPTNTCDLYIQDGVFFVLNQSEGINGGESNSVPILQITTNGKFSFCTGVQCFIDGDGSDLDHQYLCLTDIYAGCTNPDYDNYDPDATVPDGSCPPVVGCNDPEACNYEQYTSGDNELCTFPGCCSINACNFDPEAGCNLSGSCIYPDCTDPEACNYALIVDCPDDSICDYPGCNNSNACNFDPDAGCNDGSCLFAECNDPNACEYSPEVDCIDNSLCDYPGCLDVEACNYNSAAVCEDSSVCRYLESFTISGEAIVAPNIFYTYSYPSAAGAEYEWSVQGAEVVNGYGTAQIEVMWTGLGVMMVSVKETNNPFCIVPRIYFPVEVREVEETRVPTDIEIYPNPVDDQLTVNLTQEWLNSSLALYNAEGRLMLSVDEMVNEYNAFDLSALPAGMYILELVNLQEEVIHQKITVR